VRDSGQLTFQTMGGDTVTVPVRSKRYVQQRGYAAPPGTGPQGETCGSCKHIHREEKYRKCSLNRAAWTGGPRTDILARAPACLKWIAPADQQETKP
jgi:hypothetical protein